MASAIAIFVPSSFPRIEAYELQFIRLRGAPSRGAIVDNGMYAVEKLYLLTKQGLTISSLP